MSDLSEKVCRAPGGMGDAQWKGGVGGGGVGVTGSQGKARTLTSALFSDFVSELSEQVRKRSNTGAVPCWKCRKKRVYV